MALIQTSKVDTKLTSQCGTMKFCVLSGNPTSRVIIAYQEEHGEGNDEFSLQSIFVFTLK
jgi:hypothetical protein